MKFFVIFNHELTDDQVKQINRDLKCEEIIYLPDNLQQAINEIPPQGGIDRKLLKALWQWVENNSNIGDHVLVQTEYGVTVYLVNKCIEAGRVAVYSTTKRNYDYEDIGGGKVRNVHVFKHVDFRKFRI